MYICEFVTLFRHQRRRRLYKEVHPGPIVRRQCSCRRKAVSKRVVCLCGRKHARLLNFT